MGSVRAPRGGAEADAPRSAQSCIVPSPRASHTHVTDRRLQSWAAISQNGGSAEASGPKHRLTPGEACGVFQVLPTSASVWNATTTQPNEGNQRGSPWPTPQNRDLSLVRDPWTWYGPHSKNLMQPPHTSGLCHKCLSCLTGRLGH